VGASAAATAIIIQRGTRSASKSTTIATASTHSSTANEIGTSPSPVGVDASAPNGIAARETSSGRLASERHPVNPSPSSVATVRLRHAARPRK
jgi:hypothetical protein